MVKINHRMQYSQHSAPNKMPAINIWNRFKALSKISGKFAYHATDFAIKEIVSGFNLSAGLTRETTHSLIQGASWTGNFFWAEAKKGTIVTSKAANKASAYFNLHYRAVSSSTIRQLIKGKEACATFISDSLISLSKDETKEKINDLILKSCGYFSLGFAISVTSKQPFAEFFSNLGIPYPIMPIPLYHYGRGICLLEKSLPASNSFNRYFINRPLFHGLLLTLFQEGLLKKLPEKLLKRSAPSYSHLVDSQSAKIARITLAASFFSLSSTMGFFWNNRLFSMPYFDTTAHLLTRFAIGLILGTIQEKTENPLYMIATHAGLNIGFFPENFVPLCPPPIELG